MPTIDAATGNVLAIIDGTVGGASIPTGGNVAAGTADSGNPVKVGGVGSDTHTAPVNNGERVNAAFNRLGQLEIAAGSYDGTPGADGRTLLGLGTRISITDTAVAPIPLAIGSFTYSGSTWDRLRSPAVFKSFSALAIAAETTVWTPTAGKKFRLMGFVITQTVATGDIVVRDNTAGTAILTIPATPVGQPLSLSMGNGILSAAANNVLTFDGGVGELVSGFVYGTEE